MKYSLSVSAANALVRKYNSAQELMNNIVEEEEQREEKRMKAPNHAADHLMAVDKQLAQEAFAKIKGIPACTLEFHKGVDLPKSDITACYNIVHATSYPDYAGSNFDWNKKSKMKELQNPNMLFVIVRANNSPDAKVNQKFSNDVDTDILAFTSFKLDYDDPPYEDETVVYIYEVHVADTLRGKGLGTFFVSVAEHMARQVSVDKTMLTVFTSNEKAMNLYKRMGYAVDQASPDKDIVLRNRVVKKTEYLIMSKEKSRGKRENWKQA